MKNLALTVLVVLLIFLSACGSQPQPTQFEPSSQIPVIYDDDGSPDGTTALFYLLSHPQVDLQAVTISYGEAHPEIYIQHIAGKLAEFGITDIPLGYGQDGPLAGTNEFPEEVRQAANDFWGLPRSEKDGTYSTQAAPELIVTVINDAPAPVTVFVSGPATNLAQALRLDPSLKENIQAVYMMGGAVYVPGNIQDFYPNSENEVAEWNIFADAQAAKEVFESGIDIYLVPLDATNYLPVTMEFYKRLERDRTTSVAEFVYRVLTMQQQYIRLGSYYFWDPLAAAIATEEALATFQQIPLIVVEEEGPESGRTLKSERGFIIRVAMQADRERFEALFLDAVNGRLP